MNRELFPLPELVTASKLEKKIKSYVEIFA